MLLFCSRTFSNAGETSSRKLRLSSRGLVGFNIFQSFHIFPEIQGTFFLFHRVEREAFRFSLVLLLRPWWIALGHFQEKRIDSNESGLQPFFDQPSEVFQAAAEDPSKTHSVCSAPAFSHEAGFSLPEFSSS